MWAMVYYVVLLFIVSRSASVLEVAFSCSAGTHSRNSLFHFFFFESMHNEALVVGDKINVVGGSYVRHVGVIKGY